MMCLTTCLKFLLGKPVGLIFVGHYVTNDKVETDKFELAWNLDSTVWGRGYATEAARAVIQHAKEEGGVTRLHALAHPENEKSLAVCQRLGMEKMGLTEEWYDISLVEYILDLN